MSEAHHYQIVRGYDHRVLTAGARHVIGVLGNRQSAITIDPEEAAINGSRIGNPRRSQSAHEVDEPFRKNSLAVPDAVLKIQVPEPRPVACRCEVISLRE